MIERFAERLADWQKRHGRHDLPWQQRGPYETWISEIMLQQTQVQVVIPYFNRFVASFPSEEVLAAAPVDDVLAHWAGLGYYSRARNLHRAAQVIMQEHQGSLPNDLDALIALPGIGRSTAGAIVSLGFGARGVIQDGNVRRVLSRVFCISGDLSKSNAQNQLWDLADSLTPDDGAGSKVHAQAMMDLGSLICRRSKPNCVACPVADDCQALQRNAIAKFPERKQVKQRKDAAAIYIEQNRQDLADDELAQVSILEEFLPEQLSEDEIRQTVEAIMTQMGASSMADMGKVMGAANKQLAGRADGKLIAQIVKSKLS